MTTSFPTGLDSFTNPTSTDNLDQEVGTRTHSEMHGDINDAVEALQTKVGVDSSAVTTSLDYYAKVLAILKTVIDAKGDILVGTAADTIARLAVGANNTVLMADSAQSTGVKWSTVSRPMVMSAGMLESLVGSATLGTVGTARQIAWLLDASSNETVVGMWACPSDWVTINIDLYWTNAGAGSGDVIWQTLLESIADGAALGVTGGSDTTAAIAAPAQDVLKVTRTATGRAVTPTNLQSLRIVRRASDGGDTLANDVALLGAVITRAS